jgi:hypothetical protein
VFENLQIDKSSPRYQGVEGFSHLLVDMARRLDAMGNGAEKAALAQEAFHRGWQRVIPVLGDLGKQMDAADAELRRLHVDLGPETQRQANAFEASFQTLSKVVGNAKTILLNTFGEAMIPLMDAVKGAIGRLMPRLEELTKHLGEELVPVP